MRIEFSVNGTAEAAGRYLTWAPSPLRLRLLEAAPSAQPVAVTLREQRAPDGGSLLFSDTPAGTPKAQLQVALPTDGRSVTVFVRGKFRSPSKADGDAGVVALDASAQPLGTLALMVRIRKNANTLTPAERDRFVSALAQLNNRGTGRFADFRNMHVAGAADRQEHGAPGFLPWHRTYLLDLERELQAIDASVALPYWRFDRPAPFLFTHDFVGVPDALGTVQFGPSNPLMFWTTDGVQGVNRRLIGVDPALRADPSTLTEADTLALGGTFRAFRAMEGNPHGFAHTQYFSGSIASIPTAARDPLFFLLHCNVDRLWAKWQRQFDRHDPARPGGYDPGPTPTGLLAGHNLGDSLWPWNGITTPPRPSSAPGGTLARSSCVVAPGDSPRVKDMFDYQGALAAAAQLGFSYDDVPLA